MQCTSKSGRDHHCNHQKLPDQLAHVKYDTDQGTKCAMELKHAQEGHPQKKHVDTEHALLKRTSDRRGASCNSSVDCNCQVDHIEGVTEEFAYRARLPRYIKLNGLGHI